MEHEASKSHPHPHHKDTEELLTSLEEVQPHRETSTLTISITPGKIFGAGILIGLLIMGVPTAFLWAKINGGTSVVAARDSGTPTNSNPTPSAPQPTGEVPAVGKDDYILGDKNADLTIVEYSDLECPYCKEFHPTVKQAITDYKGKVNFVYRHFPLPFHNPGAQKEAEAVECAGELGGSKKYYEFIDKIFERTTSNGTGFPIEKLVPLAKELGLNEKKFQTCLDEGKMTQKVDAQRNAAQDAGINGTPGSILTTKDGKSARLPGLVSLSQLKSRIDGLLAK
jgi:protein-disulfide isomerase